VFVTPLGSLAHECAGRLVLDRRGTCVFGGCIREAKSFGAGARSFLLAPKKTMWGKSGKKVKMEGRERCMTAQTAGSMRDERRQTNKRQMVFFSRGNLRNLLSTIA
jgi:hypothetical protein